MNFQLTSVPKLSIIPRPHSWNVTICTPSDYIARQTIIHFINALPCNNLDKSWTKRNPSFGIKNAGVSVSNEITWHNLFLCISQVSALIWAFRGFLHNCFDFIIGCLQTKAYYILQSSVKIAVTSACRKHCLGKVIFILLHNTSSSVENIHKETMQPS